mmetsp:Transcript_29916/g.64063  ORF Transcript_29916/g.64063 Transcript_29916/m.64063 type:complete len:218 (+) Transcript_29916:1030-1683(+)
MGILQVNVEVFFVGIALVTDIELDSVVVRGVHRVRDGMVQRQIRHHLNKASVVFQSHVCRQDVRRPSPELFPNESPRRRSTHRSVRHTRPLRSGARDGKGLGKVVDGSRVGTGPVRVLGLFHGNVVVALSRVRRYLRAPASLVDTDRVREIDLRPSDLADFSQEGHRLVVFLRFCFVAVGFRGCPQPNIRICALDRTHRRRKMPRNKAWGLKPIAGR